MKDSICHDCYGSIVVDNKSHSLHTVLTLEGRDQPGLLRMITWVLNGLGLSVQNSKIYTSSDGNVKDVFWLTDFRHNKLSDDSASRLSERLVDFLAAFEPTDPRASPVQEWRYGAIEISNLVHPSGTQLLIRGEPEGHRPGFLFDIVTVLSSVGATIIEGTVQGTDDLPTPIAQTGGKSVTMDGGMKEIERKKDVKSYVGNSNDDDQIKNDHHRSDTIHSIGLSMGGGGSRGRDVVKPKLKKKTSAVIIKGQSGAGREGKDENERGGDARITSSTRKPVGPIAFSFIPSTADSSDPFYAAILESFHSSFSPSTSPIASVEGPTSDSPLSKHDFAKQGRIFKFLLADYNGRKLDPSRVATLIFTLDIITGRGHLPTVPPNLEVFLKTPGCF
eukprot:CAMPEP_0175055502 /NCGR_PEP_ID=MMETSP0052_2-20121109/10119_1 /TAXON_ID=51329 ORGANISM="Polytomella parva, Strain SAG 63-3" /NCGR_SAMPLE_ID=MMETSP0052_2 /ASSEMBLY_ACC=CAM_ASM_000194 /LENGTH=389 /DNA_ID=CAMNT_0016320361 /DNA_START=173 /DNA_END=1342 /DNA_ORIENTATION=-